MNCINYIFNHNFGYGQDLKDNEISKITLRNLDDLVAYIDFSIIELFTPEICNRLIRICSQTKLQKYQIFKN